MPNDVDLSIGVDASATSVGLAELRNFGTQARADLQGIFAGAFTVGAAVAAFDAVINKAHEIHHEAERFGIDAEQLQLIGNAAKEDGLSLESVAKAMNLVEIAGAKALSAGSAQAAALNQLGIEATYFNSLNPSEKILTLADAWNASSKSGEDYAAIAKLIGARFGTELIPVLEKGSAAIRNVSSEMAMFGDQTIESLEKIHRSNEQLKNELSVGLGTAIGFFANVFRVQVAAVITIWDEVVTSFVSGASVINRVLHFDFSGALSAWKAGIDQMKGLVQNFTDIKSEIFNGPPKTDARGPGGTGAGGAATLGDATLSGGRGVGGGGTSSEESLQARIAKIEQENAAQQRTDEEQLNALKQKAVDLTNAMLTAQGHIGGVVADQKTQLEATLAVAENNKAMDETRAKIAQDQLEYDKKIADEREKLASSAGDSLTIAKEENKEFALQLSGRKDLAERAKIQFDYDNKIKDAQDAITYAQQHGYTEVVATNQALLAQLTLEKQNALATHDKAIAEEKAAAAAKAANDTKAAAQTLADLREETREIQLQETGHVDIANRLHDHYTWQLKINDALGIANDLWYKAAQAYASNNKALGDELVAQAKLNEATAQELKNQEAITAQLNAQNVELQRQAAISKGMQDFVNAVSSYTADELAVGSSDFQALLAGRSGKGFDSREQQQRYYYLLAHPDLIKALDEAAARMGEQIKQAQIEAQASQIVAQANQARTVAAEIAYLQSAIPQLQGLINPSENFQVVQFLQQQLSTLQSMLTQLQGMSGSLKSRPGGI